MDFDLENPLTSLQSDTVSALFASESHHMPSQDYLQRFQDFKSVFVRRETISLILQAQFASDFDPSLAYLAINYLDRFISKEEIPQGKPWILKLLAMSCISLAAKMKKHDFSLTDLQGEEGFIFDSQTIQRMELLILNALKWRMRSITPFSFLHFFVSLFKLTDPPLRQALKDHATEIILKSQNCSTDVKLLMFKPSIIAASALLSASHELFPLQFPSFQTAISSCSYLNQEKLLECYSVMEDFLMDGYQSLFDKMFSSETTDNVLDLHFSTSSSDDESSETIVVISNNNKRRKIERFCNTLRFHQSVTTMLNLR
ncbi:hypothetical protein GIB67_018862 [Kingdonia uniflora]|uniref:B-like cyclin n=1 Tax=Kingdonia uniflora TaxID=39325 RepID=A0A7J7PBN3_9MAGN|nr:hypothetical protein GIB67_018862 [Kingdonia uniflora]